MSTSNLRFPQWQEPLLQAAIELKPEALIEKFRIAEAAILQRLAELTGNTESGEETEALDDALSTLRVLKGILDKE